MVLKSQNTLMKILKSADFRGKTWFVVALENFLHNMWACCGYLEGRPNVALYNEAKTTVTRRVDQEISLQNRRKWIFYGFEESEYSDEKFEKC